MAMQTHHDDETILALLFNWVRYHLTVRLRAMRPVLTTEQVAAVVALSGNPTGT